MRLKFKNFRCFILGLPLVWYYLGTLDKKMVRTVSFGSGLALSQRYKTYPSWDKYIEPIIIRQLAVLDCAIHSFIKGMISDNADKSTVNLAFDEFKEEIKKDLFGNDHERNE